MNKTTLRHASRALAGIVPALLLCGMNLRADGAPARPNSGEWRPLFNGRDLGGWYTWVAGKGKNSDPDKIFQVHDGIIHIYKDAVAGGKMPYGYIATERELENYDIRLEYRWGEKKFAPREKGPRDSGLLYHSVGRDGAFWGAWPRSVECQIQEGDTGDICAVQTRLTTTVETNAPMYKSNGVPTTINGGIIKHSRNSQEVEGWNRVEVRVRGNCATHIVNGVVNAVVTDIHQPDPSNPTNSIPLTKGRLLLQAEGAEIFYRNIEIRELPSAFARSAQPQAVAGLNEALMSRLGWKVAAHNHWKPTTYWNPEFALSVVKAYKPWIGLGPDTGHWFRSGLSTMDSLRMVEGHIVSMHFKDLDQNKHDVPFGAGVNHAADQLAELKRQGFKGVITIEYESQSEHRHDDILKCVAFLNENAARLAP